MIRPDTILEDVHATRRKLYEITKNMTTSERVVYFNKRAEVVANKYGFKLLTSTHDSDSQTYSNSRHSRTKNQ